MIIYEFRWNDKIIYSGRLMIVDGRVKGVKLGPLSAS